MATRDNPNSLFRICVKYVGTHTEHIESLIGFPEIMGKEIFKIAVACNKFAHPHFTSEMPNALKLFFDAYGYCDILESLYLSNGHLLLSDMMDNCWWVLEYLVHLDLSSCGLGDNHDVLPSVFECLRLKTLVLKDNSLTDEGLRRMTAKSRMYQNYSSALDCLDISENYGITVRSLGFLRCLSRLSVLNLSRTAVSEDEVKVHSSWQAYFTDAVCDCITSTFNVKTKGWAADVIESWKKEYDKLSARQSTQSSSSHQNKAFHNPDHFYSRRKAAIRMKSSLHNTKTPRRQNSGTLILVSHQFSCPHLQSYSDTSQTLTVNRVSNPEMTTKFICPKSTIIPGNRVSESSKSCSGFHQSESAQCNTQDISDESKAWLLSQYQCSHPRKRNKRLSMLERLEESL